MTQPVSLRAVITHNEAYSLALDTFESVYVCLVVVVPYYGSILENGSN